MARFVAGYHGCHTVTAEALVTGNAFQRSQNGYDWLGEGIYFWEDGPNRAAEWARQRFGDSGAVVKATVDLGRCLNLLDTAHFSGLERV
jgi:hypothetical protein